MLAIQRRESLFALLAFVFHSDDYFVLLRQSHNHRWGIIVDTSEYISAAGVTFAPVDTALVACKRKLCCSD